MPHARPKQYRWLAADTDDRWMAQKAFTLTDFAREARKGDVIETRDEHTVDRHEFDGQTFRLVSSAPRPPPPFRKTC